eukprot:TRINITY_DN113247_c0_g1_i1.p1 TRINITY_DN113247_c0_g1~~TRINITY_DN113247_c0_g1_i1.p1  ORF type:complete len:112 (-),score=30.60 TRINITY_DN113247_c0_g1_i1:105-440(-)
MMFGRIMNAARFSAQAGASRGFATKVYSPKPLSIRKDGLMAGCIIAALVHFVPQDLIFVSGLFWSWHNTASATSPKQKHADASAALDDFKAKKGLDKVNVYKGSSTWYVSV